MKDNLQKIILKNTHKYKVLKLAKGIDLGEFMFYSANYSVKSFYKDASDWVYTGDERVYFKSGASMSFAQTQSHRIVNELLYDELANQIGLPVAKYEPASYKDISSLISHDVTFDTDEELCSIYSIMNLPPKYDMSFEKLVKKIGNINGFEDYQYDSKKMIIDLYKMMVLDSLTFQEDRHDDNIHLLVDPQRKKFKLSPIIDNEYAFGAKTLNSYFDIKSFEENYYMDKYEFLAKHGSNMEIVMTDKIYMIPSTQKYEANVKDIIKFAYNKPECKSFLINALNTIDINKAIENVEKLGYQISDDYKEYLNSLIDLSKEIYAECIKQLKSTNEQNEIFEK